MRITAEDDQPRPEPFRRSAPPWTVRIESDGRSEPCRAEPAERVTAHRSPLSARAVERDMLSTVERAPPTREHRPTGRPVDATQLWTSLEQCEISARRQ